MLEECAKLRPSIISDEKGSTNAAGSPGAGKTGKGGSFVIKIRTISTSFEKYPVNQR
jgi:hypothetical protein